MRYRIIEFTGVHYRITEFAEVHYRNIEFPGMHYRITEFAEVHYRIIELTRVHYRIRQDVTFLNTVDKQSSGVTRRVECETFTDTSEELSLFIFWI
jgi:hypothetical protein